MTVSTIIIIGVAVAILLAVALGGRRGPRVTHITRTVRKEKDEGDA